MNHKTECTKHGIVNAVGNNDECEMCLREFKTAMIKFDFEFEVN